MWTDIAYLGTKTKTENDYGDVYDVISYDKMIYCNEKSIRQSEFYQAKALGLQPTITIEVMCIDYNDEMYVKFNDKEYTVLRTYKKSPERMELVLERGISHATS